MIDYTPKLPVLAAINRFYISQFLAFLSQALFTALTESKAFYNCEFRSITIPAENLTIQMSRRQGEI